MVELLDAARLTWLMTVGLLISDGDVHGPESSLVAAFADGAAKQIQGLATTCRATSWVKLTYRT